MINHGDGTYSVGVSDSKAETIELSVNVSGADFNISAIFTHGLVDTNNSKVTQSRDEVVVNDQYEDENGTTIITVYAIDTNGNPIEDAIVTLDANDTNGTISKVDTNNSKNGIYIFKVYDTKVETVEYNATVNGKIVIDTATVIFTQGKIDADISKVQLIDLNNGEFVDDLNMTLDEVRDNFGVTVIITLLDRFGNPVFNAPILPGGMITDDPDLTWISGYGRKGNLFANTFMYPKPVENFVVRMNLGEIIFSMHPTFTLTIGETSWNSENRLVDPKLDIYRMQTYNQKIEAKLEVTDYYKNPRELVEEDIESVRLTCLYNNGVPETLPTYSCDHVVLTDLGNAEVELVKGGQDEDFNVYYYNFMISPKIVFTSGYSFRLVIKYKDKEREDVVIYLENSPLRETSNE